MSTITHLTTTLSFTKQSSTSLSNEIVHAFIRSCLALDVSIFEPFMLEHDVFEDKEKYVFLNDLKCLFNGIKLGMACSYEVILRKERCQGCNYGKEVKVFQVQINDDRSIVGEFAFMIVEENGILFDIYRCPYYKEGQKVFLKPEGLPGIFIDYSKSTQQKD